MSDVSPREESGSDASVAPAQGDEESLKCLCEWVHPMDGSVGGARGNDPWPAVLDPDCPVHTQICDPVSGKPDTEFEWNRTVLVHVGTHGGPDEPLVEVAHEGEWEDAGGHYDLIPMGWDEDPQEWALLAGYALASRLGWPMVVVPSPCAFAPPANPPHADVDVAGAVPNAPKKRGRIMPPRPKPVVWINNRTEQLSSPETES